MYLEYLILSADNHSMTLHELTDEFLLYLGAVRGLSENTVKGYGNDLAQLLGFLTPDLDIKSVTRENLMLCIGQLSKQKKSAATVNRFIAAVRTLFAYATKMKYIEKNSTSCSYELIGVVSKNNNNENKDDFIAYCKGYLNNQWIKFCDTLSEQVKDVKNEVIDSSVPYLLFYKKIKN